MRILLGYDFFTSMRAMLFVAVIGLAVTSSAYAQAQSSTAMTVSVRVIRSCNIAAPGSPSITTRCDGAAEPRAQLIAPAPAPTPSAPSASLSEPRGDAGAFRVLTVNF